MWHLPATPSSGSRFRSDRLVSSALVVYTVFGVCCTGSRPSPSAPRRTCITTGPVPVDLRFPLPSCHTLRYRGYGSPARERASPWSVSFGISEASNLQWQNEMPYGLGIGGSILAELYLSLSSSLVTVEVGSLFLGSMSAEAFGLLYSGLGFLL